MVPSILMSKSGDMLVIGGAGGGWIISATTMVSETTASCQFFQPSQISSHGQSHLLLLLSSPEILTPWCFFKFAI